MATTLEIRNNAAFMIAEIRLVDSSEELRHSQVDERVGVCPLLTILVIEISLVHDFAIVDLRLDRVHCHYR